MVVDRLRPELLHPAIVGVADERREAVRLGVGLDELQHPLEPSPRARGQRLAVQLEQQIRTVRNASSTSR